MAPSAGDDVAVILQGRSVAVRRAGETLGSLGLDRRTALKHDFTSTAPAMTRRPCVGAQRPALSPWHAAHPGHLIASANLMSFATFSCRRADPTACCATQAACTAHSTTLMIRAAP